MNLPKISRHYHAVMRLSTLSQHFQFLMGPWLQRVCIHPTFAPHVKTSIAQDTNAILTNADAICQGLLELETAIEQHPSQDIEQVMRDFIGEPLLLDYEMTVDQFLGSLTSDRPMYDVGPSPIHGKFSHAIQHYILQLHLGKERVEELFELIRTGPVVTCERMPDQKWTLFDELLDRPTPLSVPNSEKLPCWEAVKEGCHTPVPVTTTLDARSPEWLTVVISMAEKHGIDRVRDAVMGDLKTRGENVHTGMFITGFESEEFMKIWQPTCDQQQEPKVTFSRAF